MQQAQKIIEDQTDVPLGIKRSAWLLFRHELSRIDPGTGRPYTARRALHNVLRWIAGQRARERIVRITPAELRILKLLVEGLTMAQIALETGTNERVVRRHLQKIRRKTGAVNTYRVIAIAVDRGWVQAPRVEGK